MNIFNVHFNCSFVFIMIILRLPCCVSGRVCVSYGVGAKGLIVGNKLNTRQDKTRDDTTRQDITQALPSDMTMSLFIPDNHGCIVGSPTMHQW